jgi:phosphoribosyl-AMP cyclohydrolase
MPTPPVAFHLRRSVEAVEEGCILAPKFGSDGLMPCVTTDAATGEVLMLGWMNPEALRLTLETGEAHYFSRSRQVLWRKGATSGLVQRVIEARIDDDQDALWLRVAVAGSGASCHVGYRSCFYRAVPTGPEAGGPLRFAETARTFDPVAVYGDAPNPTQL